MSINVVFGGFEPEVFKTAFKHKWVRKGLYIDHYQEKSKNKDVIEEGDEDEDEDSDEQTKCKKVEMSHD